MNLFADIRSLVIDCLDALAAEGQLPTGLAHDNVTVEPPRDPAHGDMATNAAMVLAKPAGLKPRAIAEAHDGVLRARDRAGGGARFELRLPALDARLDDDEEDVDG